MMRLPEMLEIESKVFGPDCSLEQRKALSSRVCKIDDNVFYFKEVKCQSIFQLDLMFDRLSQLRENSQESYLIVDLTETSQPSAEIREHIRKKYQTMASPTLVALVVGNNYLIRLAARFVAGRTLKVPYVVVQSYEQGLQKVLEHLNSREIAS